MTTQDNFESPMFTDLPPQQQLDNVAGIQLTTPRTAPSRRTRGTAGGGAGGRRWGLAVLVLGLGSGIFASGLAVGTDMGRRQAAEERQQQETELRQRVIDCLVAETGDDLWGDFADAASDHTPSSGSDTGRAASHFAIETFDRRDDVIAVTGIERNHDGEYRVGRFWVELRLLGGQWEPQIVHRKMAQGRPLRQAFDWP